MAGPPNAVAPRRRKARNRAGNEGHGTAAGVVSVASVVACSPPVAVVKLIGRLSASFLEHVRE